MSKFEKLVYVGCPWFFGMVLVVVALLNASEMETTNNRNVHNSWDGDWNGLCALPPQTGPVLELVL